MIGHAEGPPTAHLTRAAPTPQPFGQIDPPTVLQALDALGLRGDGRLLALNSYENRVLKVYVEDGSAVVAKLYRPGRWSDAQILEEHAFGLELAAQDVPVVAPCPLATAGSMADCPVIDLLGEPTTLAAFQVAGVRHRLSVSPCHAGREADLEAPDTLRWIGRFIGRLHAVGAQQPFAHRQTLNVASRGDDAIARVAASGHLPHACAAAWRAAAHDALAPAREAFQALPDLRRLRLHGDFHAGNLLWRPEGPHIVDLDDACNGPAVQDLWMLVGGDRDAMRGRLGWLLEGYETFMEFDDRELTLIEPLRTLRMLHHSAWLAERWHDPAFPAAFPWFGTSAYWQEQTMQLREQAAGP